MIGHPTNKIELAHSALNYINANCSREEWIRIGMSAKVAGLSFEDWHNWSKNAKNYKGEKDCTTTWNSFDNSGAVTPGTLFYIARQQGWQDHKNITNSINNKKTYTQKKKNISQVVNNYPNNAVEIWKRCVCTPPTHEYILRKRGNPDGLRYYPLTEPPLIISGIDVTGYLVVPCFANDKIQTLQFISPKEGLKKLNLTGASFNDGYFIVGEINNLIYICEGIGQAWAINKATGMAAVVCFGSSRMPTVAKVLREQYPKERLVIVPDHGEEKKAAEIATAIHGHWIEFPEGMKKNEDANDYAQKHGYDNLNNLLSSVKKPEMRYKLNSGGELLNAAPMRWMVQGVIPEKGLVALYGESASGKSFLILDMAFTIAVGEQYWFGLRVTKAPVTYVCLEGESGLGKRIKAWGHFFNKPIPDRLRFVTQPFNLLSDDIVELANAIIAAGGAGGLVIIDTLNRAAPGADENSSVDMGKIIAAAKTLQNLINGVVLLVHHTGKDKTKGLRGHSSLYAALDGAIEVIKTDYRREWSIAKSKDDITGNSNSFKLEIVNVGLDSEGQKITSCVTLFDGSKEIFRKKPSLGSNQKIALEEIDKQLQNSPHTGKEDAPASAKCLDYDEAISLVAKRMPAGAKHRKSRAQTAIAALIGRKYLGMKGDWLWRI